jgi:hypothetical protein
MIAVTTQVFRDELNNVAHVNYSFYDEDAIKGIIQTNEPEDICHPHVKELTQTWLVFHDGEMIEIFDHANVVALQISNQKASRRSNFHG